MSAELSEQQEGSGQADKRRNVEAILPLLPMQRVLLYASVNARAAADDPGVIQVRFTIEGRLEVNLLQRAWGVVVDRYAGLRMAVRSAPGKDPLAVVWKRIETPWQLFDWTQLTDRAFEEQRQNYLVEDRRRGLSTADAPVMRFAVLRRSDHLHEIVWTCHHLLLDGWSCAIVVNDLVTACRNLMQHQPADLPSLHSDHREYLAWWRSRDVDVSRGYWREALSGITPLAPMDASRAGRNDKGAPSSAGEVDADLGVTLSGRLQSACLQHRLTPNALILGAWSLLLSALHERGDVLFGTTVAGRPANLVGAELLVGMFVNNIPVRICVDTETHLGDCLQAIRDRQIEAAGHADIGLDEIQSELGLPASQPLFETLVVVENFPWRTADDGQELRVRDYHSGLMSTYPLMLAVIPGNDWLLKLMFDRRCLDDVSAAELLDMVSRVFENMLDGMSAPVVQMRDRFTTEPSVSVLRTRLGLDRPAQQPVDVLEDTELDDFVPPRTETQLKLAAIWEEVLGVRPISIVDDFFALGGNSMAAVRLFAQIERRLQRKLPLTALLERPTIQALGELIESGVTSRWRSLVPIRAAGTRPPLFCVHAGGEHVLYYRHLAQRLTADQPVFGLQPPGLDGEDRPLWRIEEIASHYVDELRQVQPHGPYSLLGYCIGASVCLEMALKLEAEGERVNRLIVLDSGFWWGPEPTVSVLDRDDSPRLIRVLRKIGEVARRDGFGFLVKLVNRNISLIWERAREAANQRRILFFGTAEARRAMWNAQVDAAAAHAFRHYAPRRCQAPAVLVRTTEYLSIEEKQRHLIWRDVTASLDVRVVDGMHDTLLNEPTVAQVAQIVAEYLPAQVPAVKE